MPPRRTARQEDSFRTLIHPYVKSTQLFACPSNTANSALTYDNDQPTAFPISYVANGLNAVIGGTAPMPVDNGTALSAINQPSQTITICESTNAASNALMNATDTPDAYAASITNHLGNTNWLFADGHVKALKHMATGTPFNMWTIEEDGVGPATLMDRLAAADIKLR